MTGETGRYSIRSQSPLNFSPVILTGQAYPSRCRFVMGCAWRDCSALKSFTAPLARRSPASARVGALGLGSGSRKGNEVSSLSLVVVVKWGHVKGIFLLFL